jgi:hypothetical protein
MINIPQIPLSFLSHGFKNYVSGGMAISVIHLLEMIQIKYAYGKRMNTPFHKRFLIFQNFEHLASVEYLSKVIHNGKPFDCGEGMGYLRPKLGNVSAYKGKPGKNQRENHNVQHVYLGDQLRIDFIKQKYNQRVIDNGKNGQKQKLPDIQSEKPEDKNNQISKKNQAPHGVGVIRNHHDPECGNNHLKKSQAGIFELFI